VTRSFSEASAGKAADTVNLMPPAAQRAKLLASHSPRQGSKNNCRFIFRRNLGTFFGDPLISVP